MFDVETVIIWADTLTMRDKNKCPSFVPLLPIGPPHLAFFFFCNGPMKGHLLPLLVGICLGLQVQAFLDFSLPPSGRIISYSQDSQGILSVYLCRSLSPLILHNRWGCPGCISYCRVWTPWRLCPQLIYPWIPHSTVCPLSSSLKMYLRSI